MKKTLITKFITFLFLLFFPFSNQAQAQLKKEVIIQTGNLISFHDLRTRIYNRNSPVSLEDFGITTQFNIQFIRDFYFSSSINVSFLNTSERGMRNHWNPPYLTYRSSKGGKYFMSHFLFGPKYYFYLKQKVNIAASVRYGMAYVKVSDNVIKVNNTNNDKIITRKEQFNFTPSLCFNSNIEFSYRIFGSFDLVFDLAYFYNKFNMNALFVEESHYPTGFTVGGLPINNSRDILRDEKTKVNFDNIVASIGIKCRF